MTIDLYCQRCIDYVDILLGVPPPNHNTVGENGDFQSVHPKISRHSQTVSNRPRLLLTIKWKFAVDFFASGLHTRTAVARLPLHQLGFLVLCMVVYIMRSVDTFTCIELDCTVCQVVKMLIVCLKLFLIHSKVIISPGRTDTILYCQSGLGLLS